MEHVSYPLLIPSYEQHSIPSFKYYCFILENTKDLLGLLKMYLQNSVFLILFSLPTFKFLGDKISSPGLFQ